MIRIFSCFLLFFLGTWHFCLSQCTSITASVSTSLCLEEKVSISNTTTASSFEWDFCSENLKQTPIAKLSGTLSNFSTAVDIKIVKDGTNWYGFVLGLSNTITRVNFGNSPDNVPAFTELGNLGGALSSPSGMDVVQEGNKWYGVIVNANSSQLLLLTFGTSLSNVPATSVLLSLGGGNPFGVVRLAPNGSGHTALVTEFSANNIKIIPFPNGLEQSAGVISNVTVPANPLDIQVVERCGNWSAFVLGFNTKTIYRLDFGNSLLNSATTQTLTSFSFYPYRIWAGREGDEYNCFVANSDGGLYRMALGTDLYNSSPTNTDLGSFGVLNVSNSLTMVNDSGKWSAFMVNGTGNPPIYQLSFPDNCGSNASLSTVVSPANVLYTSAGSKKITLTAFQTGNTSSVSYPLVIQNLSVPDIDFSSQNICVNHDINFISNNQSGNVASYDWDFGDMTTHSLNPNPFKTYSSAGIYDVTLKVTASNGCNNSISKTLKIYIEPVASFTNPTGLICTNNEFTFVNSTPDNFDGNLSYQWLVDNNPESTLRDFKYAFTSPGDKEIKLIASIPGCSDEDGQSVLNVQAGPTVGFTISGKCEGETVNFTNTSSGAIAGYVWNSGNGQTGTNVNFSQSYAAKGVYNVSLETTGANGCVSTTTKPLTIYSLPQPNFSLDLPPFSCSGTPSQFNDLTPSPTDSNLSSWAWSFGDAGTSTDRNPLHTFANAGDYNVSLMATTNFGCSASVQKPVTITASPLADFTYAPACINQGTRFTDASGSGVKSWFWTIGGSTYAFSNPTHVFSGSGGFSAKLTVTGNNNCVASVTKTINVPVAPSLSFSVDNACEKQAANFKDTSPANTDPAASWSWDFAGQGTATGNAAQYSFASAGSYSVKMTSTQQSGCMYSLSKNVTINATPVAAFTSSPEWGVPPLAVQFTNTSTGANSYSWHFNDKNNSTSTLASPGFLFTDLGDYVVDLVATSALGCSGSASGKISVIIPSLDLELKQLQLVKDPTSNVYRIFVTVKNKSNYLLTSVDVVVDISGNALIKETINTSLLPDAEIVQLLNNQILPHGNLLTYLCASIEVDNDNDPFNNSKCEPVEEEVVIFNPYPNPSNGAFRFEWIAPTTDNAHFEIFNAMGQLAFEQYAESVQVGLNQVQFDLSNLNTGAYYFRFSSNSVSKTLPIQIVR